MGRSRRNCKSSATTTSLKRPAAGRRRAASWVESSLEDFPESLDGCLFVSSFVHEDGQLDPLRLRSSDRNAWLSLHEQTFHIGRRDPQGPLVPMHAHAANLACPVGWRALQLQAGHGREFPLEVLGLSDALAIDRVEIQ